MLVRRKQFERPDHCNFQGSLNSSKTRTDGLIQGCMKKRDRVAAADIYCSITKKGLELDVFLGSHSIGMFVLCESPSESVWIFDRLPERSIWTWTLYIGACARLGKKDEAMSLLQKMTLSGTRPNSFILVATLKSCVNEEEAMLIHTYALDISLENDVHFGNTLINVYGDLNNLEDASSVFNQLRKKDIVSWNSIMTACLRNKHNIEIIEHYQAMQLGNIGPNSITFLRLLKACCHAAPGQVNIVHVCIVESSFEDNSFIGTELINVYGKRGNLRDAKKIFECLSKDDLVNWNAMITECIRCEDFEEAVELFIQLLEHNVQPNSITLVAILQACSDIFILDEAMLIHRYVIENNKMLNSFMTSSLIDAYTRCGALDDACSVFDSICNKDIVSWNAMMAGYTQHRLGWESFCLFQKMCQSRCEPDEATFVIVLKACSILAMLELGHLVHFYVTESGHESKMIVNNSLIDMYFRCGDLDDTYCVFNMISKRDTWTWNTMITGISMNGDRDMAWNYLRKMQQGGIAPIHVTFLSMLSSCSQIGHVIEGCSLFSSARDSCHIESTREFYNCMVDILGRAGSLHLAEDILLTIPFDHNFIGSISLLSNCKIHNNAFIGKCSFEYGFRRDLENASIFAPKCG